MFTQSPYLEGEHGEVLSTPEQPRGEIQPPEGDLGTGGTPPPEDITEIQPIVEEPPKITPYFDLEQPPPPLHQGNGTPKLDEHLAF